MKVRDVLKALQADGWYMDRVKGGHRQLRHPAKPGGVTVAGHPSDGVPKGILNSIWKQAGLKHK
jgi:predicted RNA binding protein YcfA (HicA-like mRNA interferase family)